MTTKKTYQTPTIIQIRLVPQESVLGGCKNDVEAGPGKVTFCNDIPACATPGT